MKIFENTCRYFSIMRATTYLISVMAGPSPLRAESLTFKVYSVQSDATSIAGGRMTSLNYSNEALMGIPVVGVSEVEAIADYTLHGGYAPQIMQVEIHIDDGATFYPNSIPVDHSDPVLGQNLQSSGNYLTPLQQISVKASRRPESTAVSHQAQIKIHRLNSSEVIVQLLGASGSWQLQATADLIQSDWIPVDEDPHPTKEGVEWHLTDLASLPSQFFRVVALDQTITSATR